MPHGKFVIIKRLTHTIQDCLFLPATEYVTTRLQVAAMIVYGTNWSYSTTQEGKLVVEDTASSPVNESLDERQRAGKIFVLIGETLLSYYMWEEVLQTKG